MIDSSDIKMSSNKPYLVGAFYDWISDNDLTPYIAVDVSVHGVLVPMAYAKDGQIVLNIAASAVGSIALGEHAIEFSARFGGKLEHMTVPYGAIAAIYAKENDLLDQPGWARFKRIAKRSQKMFRMANQAKLRSYRTSK